MRLFTELYVELDQTNKTNEKVEAIRFYFERAAPADAAWAFYFLSGRKPRQIVPSKFLRDWAIEMSGIPEWLYLESRDTVGDGSETTALLVPNNSEMDETPLHVLVEQELLPLRGSDEATQKAAVTKAWSEMNYSQRLVYNKLISGAFRVTCSRSSCTWVRFRVTWYSLSFLNSSEAKVACCRLKANSNNNNFLIK